MAISIPWYRQFWVWFVMAVPLCGVVSGLSLVAISSSGHDALVVDDYYKVGKAINQSLERQQQAQALGLAFALTISNDNLTLKQSGGTTTITAARVHLYHPTLADLDQHLVVTADASGVLRSLLEQPIKGKWQIGIEAMDGSWLIQQEFTLPESMPIALVAE